MNKAKLAWAIVSFWGIAFVALLTSVIIYGLVKATLVTLIALALIALFALTCWAFIYIEENNL